VMEGAREAGFGEAQLEPGNAGHGPEWTHITASGKISAGAEGVDLRLAGIGEPGTVQFDDMSLQWGVVGGTWNDPIYKPALINPSGEEPPTVLRDAVKRVLPGEVRALADVVANPQVIDVGALWRDYASVQYQTFWGSFGWLTIYLPGLFYVLFGALLLTALAGLVVGLARGHGRSGLAILGVAVLLALAVAILTGFAKQESLLAYAGLPAAPQGRYLFVLAVPLAWLVSVGLSEIWGTKDERRRTKDESESPSSVVGGPSADVTRPSSFVLRLSSALAIWLCALALGFFAAYCLFALITPFYYS